ncbi:TIGR00266 family protein [Niveibacterium sp. 24ML]|uniref:TIGR00266 family protein n=1 Tax=Niveibacterium sp. 24ML TaxID=2985512 RepID=UPI00226E4E0A|nr:TIGR00266 family protein [Niveibacterium sp. 24ML]MCX9155972.1 TIGR00266 family protein [Niveibacterium sp. 24ML]
MQAQIRGSDAFSYLAVTLEPGESVIAESDAMSSMAADLDLQARMNGGLIAGLLRKYLAGESLFVSVFKNNTPAARSMTLVQPTPGGIRALDLHNDTFYLQPGAYLASTEGIKLGLGFAGFVSWIAGEGLFRTVVSGSGTVWYGAYGALLDKQVDGEYIVDSSHLVAYEPGIKLKLQLAGGLFSSFFGGEGLVTRVTGRGRIVVQTRSLTGLTGWINPKLR